MRGRPSFVGPETASFPDEDVAAGRPVERVDTRAADQGGLFPPVDAAAPTAGIARAAPGSSLVCGLRRSARTRRVPLERVRRYLSGVVSMRRLQKNRRSRRSPSWRRSLTARCPPTARGARGTGRGLSRAGRPPRRAAARGRARAERGGGGRGAGVVARASRRSARGAPAPRAGSPCGRPSPWPRRGIVFASRFRHLGRALPRGARAHRLAPGAAGNATLTKTTSGWRIELERRACRASTTGASTRPGCRTPPACSSRSGRSTKAAK